MEKSKVFAIIFVIIFVLMITMQYVRVAEYGLYGSKEIWAQTQIIPSEINYPYGISESEAISIYGTNASKFLSAQKEYITLTKSAESDGIIKCYPEQNLCHFTGKGIYPYGEYSKWAQSSELTGWLAIIITITGSSLILSLIIYVVYGVIEKYQNKK